MKAHKIKNMSKTDAKVLLFFILAVTLGFANACRSGGGDNKGDNMNPGDTITDTAAVQRAKDALMIRYAPGDRAESVTQNVSLPTSGANGVSISWESSDAARISTTGTVSRSDDMDTEVILTATLTKNAARDTRRFILTVTLPYGTTSELVTKLQAMPPSLSGCAARVSTTGTVTRPDDMDTEVILTATLTKNAASDHKKIHPHGDPALRNKTASLVTKLQAMPPSLSGCPAAGYPGCQHDKPRKCWCDQRTATRRMVCRSRHRLYIGSTESSGCHRCRDEEPLA